jgi:ribosomal protein S18 acetylase RimI-like enzyme
MTALSIQAMRDGDIAGVLDLINADRLPGQPVCTMAMLALATAGRSPIDSAWWEELSDLRTEVLADPAGTIVGVISYAHRSRDDAGVILWLHAREVPAVTGTLLDHALAQVADRPVVEAFSFATALGLGLEALPVRHRSTTHAALIARGFITSDLWRYMHRRLPADLPITSYRSRPSEDHAGKVLQIEENSVVVAEATIGDPISGVGVLWWIGVDPAARGRGLGLKLLGSAMDLLGGLGAKEVILYVDDDAPDGDPERSRAAANVMYDHAGFIEVDRLHSYRLTR